MKEKSPAKPDPGGESGGIPSARECPSCGKEVGDFETCPHCQANINNRLPLSYVRKAAMIGAAAGLLGLFIASANKVVPRLKIEEIESRYSGSLICVEGPIVAMDIAEREGNLIFYIEDGTRNSDYGSRLKVAAYGKLGRFEDYFGDYFPDIGDRVRVTGRLGRLSDTEPSKPRIYLTTPQRLEVVDYFDWEEVKDIGDLDMDDAEEARAYLFDATVSGHESFPRTRSVGEKVLLDDGTGQIQLVLFNSELDMIPDDEARENILRDGARFEIAAYVSSYREDLQLRPLDATLADCIVYRGRSR